MRHRVTIRGGLMVPVAGALLVGVLSAGCKTDALVRSERKVDPSLLSDLENPPRVELPPIPLTGRTEVDLVEEMALHRAMYANFLKALLTYYTEHGHLEKADWARNELNDLRLVKPYAYILDAEVPGTALRPTDTVAPADKLYEAGRALMEKGGHGIPVFYNQETMKLALAKFKELVERYPTSDKIDDAAFYIGEIHKEYFEEKDNTIALQWYQRAIDWNPQTPHAARFQMAVVYDFRLHEREKALALYQEVLEKERFNKSNVDWANRRIRELTAETRRSSPEEPPVGARPEPAGSPAPAGEGTEASPPPAEPPP